MFNVARIIILFVIIAAVLMFAYYLIYTHNINKKIISGQVSGRKMVDIPKMIMIAAIIVLMFLCALFAKEANRPQMKYSRNNYAVIDISDNDYKYASYAGSANLDDASFAKMYSKEKNPGYDKEIVDDGDFKFTIFKRSAEADSFHPDFLCVVDYNGKKTSDLSLSISGMFCEKADNKNSFGTGSGGGEIYDTMLFIGNLDEKSFFNISAWIIDKEGEALYSEAMEKAFEEDKGEFPKEEDFAVSSASADIFIN